MVQLIFYFGKLMFCNYPFQFPYCFSLIFKVRNILISIGPLYKPCSFTVFFTELYTIENRVVIILK